jgi:hypothetical protein
MSFKGKYLRKWLKKYEFLKMFYNKNELFLEET